MVPILADPSVSDNFAKQKCNLNFSHRTDSEFIHFLLDTTISIVSVVKQISPVIKAIEEKIGPDIIIPSPDPVVCIPEVHHHHSVPEVHHHEEEEEQCVALKSEFVDSNEVVAQLSEEMSLLIENLSSRQETANLTSLQEPASLGSLQDTAALHQELSNTLSQHQAAQQSSDPLPPSDRYTKLPSSPLTPLPSLRSQHQAAQQSSDPLPPSDRNTRLPSNPLPLTLR
eukprot:sb/3469583/